MTDQKLQKKYKLFENLKTVNSGQSSSIKPPRSRTELNCYTATITVLLLQLLLSKRIKTKTNWLTWALPKKTITTTSHFSSKADDTIYWTHLDVSDEAEMLKNVDFDWLAMHLPATMSMSISIVNLYSSESWSISSALCVFNILQLISF